MARAASGINGSRRAPIAQAPELIEAIKAEFAAYDRPRAGDPPPAVTDRDLLNVL
jgi:hypothetical protein